MPAFGSEVLLAKDGTPQVDRVRAPGQAEQRIARVLGHLLCALITAFILRAQLLAGPQLSLFPLYALPIALATWVLGLRAGLLWSCCAVLSWAWAAARIYPQWPWWTEVVNSGTRLFCFLLVVHVAYIIQRYPRTTRRWLQGRIEICQGCRRVRAPSGDWVSGFVVPLPAETQGAVPKVCPDCAVRHYSTSPHARNS